MTLSLDRRAMMKTGATLAGLSLAPRVALAQSDRIESLIARMTLAEKAGQCSCFLDAIRPPGIAFNPNIAANGSGATQLARVRRGEIGMLFNGVGAAGARRTQKVAIDESRLGIPLIFGADVIHGLRTVFPIPLAESGSFDLDLAERTARAAALEATAVGIHWTFAPMVDVARDQRWGRVAEGAGEDTYLGCRMAEARVRGFQGDDLRDPTRVVATPKHFAAYGAVSGGMEYNATEISPTTLRDVHLPPFRAALDAGALSIMSAFNDVDGVPASANRRLLTEILRDEWRFRGVVVSDYTADEELIAHGYAADGRDAARKAFLAGVDMSMSSDLYNRWLPDLVEKGEVPPGDLDRSVRRVLQLKEAIGLFDNPYRSISEKAERVSLATPAMLRLGREAGARAIVLLKNDGALLPLKRNPGHIALIGPFGDDRDNVVGPWAPMADAALNVSIADALRARGATFSAVRGCDPEAEIAGGIAAAVAAANAAEIVLLAVGETQTMSGEAAARADIGIPAQQMALADAIAAAGKPIVVLLRHGRALALHGAIKDAPAILATWFLGSRMGEAIADIVFGDVNPSAKLAVSFPHETGQEPYFYDHKSTGRPASVDGDQAYKARYRETRNEALYPFGHGLSYTSFTIGDMTVPARMTDKMAVAATVTNTGRVAGGEVVQLYVRDRVASRVQPIRALKGFRRVSLAPGKSERVTFALSRDDLRFWDDGRWLSEPGLFDLWVATSSINGEHRTFELI